MGGKVNCGVVNVCSCSRYKLCASHILAIRFITFIEAFIEVSLNCRGVWIQRQLLKGIYIPEIYLYTERSYKTSYLLRPVFLRNPEGNNNYTNSYKLLLLYKTVYITVYSLYKSFINTLLTLSWLWPTFLSCGSL